MQGSLFEEGQEDPLGRPLGSLFFGGGDMLRNPNASCRVLFLRKTEIKELATHF